MDDETRIDDRDSRNAPVPRRAPQSIGPYRIVKALGEGGMGEVYLAEQLEPIKRHVALKLIKIGMDTQSVVARFEAERQALASLDHTHIAKVFDAGSTADGRPFFVMELVQGCAITDYCDAERLDLGTRLQLFVQVCHAIQHAHDHGIVHRDIKPSNVLVLGQDGKHIAKVIDFGVAKATREPLTDKTLLTQAGQMLGTPEYMSPEQAAVTDTGVDGRSDVFSLGVLLYELLVGELPFRVSELPDANYYDIQRKIRDEDPPTPSRRYSSLGDDQQSVAARRATNPSKLLHALRSDLEAIAMHAMAKVAADRYQTPLELAEDLERYLNGEPVKARLPSMAERAIRWLRKRRSDLMRGTVIASLALLAGLWGSGALSTAPNDDDEVNPLEDEGFAATLYAGALAKLDQPLIAAPLSDVAGSPFALDSLLGQRVLVVMVLGFGDGLSATATPQTTVLTNEWQRLVAQEVEVVVVYSAGEERQGSFEKEYAETFANEAPPPYRVVYDPGGNFTAANGMVLADGYFLLDEKGIVRDVDAAIEAAEAATMIAACIERL